MVFQPIIAEYSPISSKGGRRISKVRRTLRNRTRRGKRSNKSRTRRHH